MGTLATVLPVDEAINLHIRPHAIEFVHGCGFEISVSYSEFWRLGAIACPKCRVVLMTLDEMVASMEEGLAKGAHNPSRREREIAETSLNETRRELLEG